jgi:hypothetical protein
MLFLFVVIFYAIISSCNFTQQQFEFFYYPAKNVYYDVTNKLYLYSLDGGKTWDSTYAYTTAEPATLGSKQIIYNPTFNVWEKNNEHVQQYDGHIINISVVDTSDLKQSLVAERKIKKINTSGSAAVTTAKEPEKKPGFFKRLFGKKNK